MNKWQYILLGTITLFGLILRSISLTSSPESLYQDEVAIGYNAYSIIETGRDEHGKFLPVFFESFGDYKLPIYIYLVAFTQLLFGPTDLSVRLPSFTFGVLTIPLIYFFSKIILENIKLKSVQLVPLISAALLSLSPWHYQFSRPGFEGTISLFFLILAVYLFFKAKKTGSYFILVYSAISFIVTLYSYHSSRIIVPIIVVTLFLLFRKSFKKTTWITFLGLTALAFINFLLNPGALVRARDVVLFYHYPFFETLRLTTNNYLQDFSFSFLFIQGDPTLDSTSAYRWGLLHLAELPFLILGLIKIVLGKEKELKFLLVYLLVGFTPAAISILNPHALRSLLILPAFILISALGLGLFLDRINFKAKLITLIIYFILITLSEISFLNIYHNQYLVAAGKDWQIGIKKSAETLKRIENKYDGIYFEESGISKIAYLWYLKYPPKFYQDIPNKTDLNYYHFGNLSMDTQSNNLYVTNNCERPGIRIIQKIYYPNNLLATCIWSF